MGSLELKNVWKIYNGSVEAVQNASFACRDGEFIALLGPSGCGKSSTMRMIAGLEDISKGEILIGNTVVNGMGPKERNIALAFESYALYSPLTVRENLAFPLVSAGEDTAEIKYKVDKVAASFHLTELLDRKPANLSGGQAQRVSLARALIRNPSVLLLDEPLSHLDYRLRATLRARIRHIHDQIGATTVYVTHDQEEAIILADRIIVMNHALIQQIGTADELWNQPVNTFVAGFLGDPAMNFLDAEVDEKGIARTKAGQLSGFPKLAGKAAILGVRPEHLTVTGPGEGDGLLAGTVFVNEFHGERCVVTAQTESGRIKAVTAGTEDYQPGEKISLRIAGEHVHMFDAASGDALAHATESSAMHH